MPDPRTQPAISARPTHDDRRESSRYDAASVGKMVARVLGGSDVRLIDLSRRGVLIETEGRLKVGAKATIRITTTDAVVNVQGVVVRSLVAKVAHVGLVFRTALALDEDLAIVDELVRREAESAEPAVAAKSAAATVPVGAADGLSAMDADEDAIALPEQLLPAAFQTDVRLYEDELDTAPLDHLLNFSVSVSHDLGELRRRLTTL
jgi:hypothetical protein